MILNVKLRNRLFRSFFMSLPIYHITHFKNLSSIIESAGLVAKSRQPNNRINYIDIAHQGIQDRRARICVPCAAGGMLHDYGVIPVLCTASPV